MTTGSDQPEWLVVGQITKPHGTKGEVMVWPLTDTPDAVFAEGVQVLAGDAQGGAGEEPEWLEVAASRPYRRGYLVRFEGVYDRSGTEPLLRRYLLMEAERAAPLEEDEVFYHDLLGAQVLTVGGEPVGVVREVFDTEPAHLLEVKGERGVHLIPFTKQVVREVDAETGRVVIDPPEGLLEL